MGTAATASSVMGTGGDLFNGAGHAKVGGGAYDILA